MKKILFLILCTASCTPVNNDTITTNSSDVLLSQISEQLDCHDPSFDICVEPDYSKDICVYTQSETVDVYVTELECKDNDEKTCR